MLARSSFVIPHPAVIQTGIDIQEIGVASVDCEQAAPVECCKESKADENSCYRQANFPTEAPFGWDKAHDKASQNKSHIKA